MYRTDFWTLWEKARVGCFKRTAKVSVLSRVKQITQKSVYYLGWNRSPAQVGCMRQALGPGALGRPRGIGWRGRCKGGSGWGTHVNPWLIHFNVWQNPLQYCKVISLQLIKKLKKVMSLLFDVQSSLVMISLPRIKCLLISWLQSPSAVSLEPKKIVSHCLHCFSIPLPWIDGTGCHDLSFLNVEL